MAGPRISDHALLRFLALAADLNVEQLRESLGAALERAHAAARHIGDNDYMISIDGLTFVVREDAATTVFESGSAPKRGRMLGLIREGGKQ